MEIGFQKPVGSYCDFQQQRASSGFDVVTIDVRACRRCILLLNDGCKTITANDNVEWKAAA